MGKKKPNPFGGYSDRAQAAFPGYVTPGSPCDACGGPVVGSRTLTWVATDGTHVSILVKTCAVHTACTYDALVALLPNLPDFGDTAYMQL
jgi:hypothetical protein